MYEIMLNYFLSIGVPLATAALWAKIITTGHR